MQELTDYNIIKLLFGILGTLVASQIALLVYVFKNHANKFEQYVKKHEKDHDLLHAIKTEHKVFHRQKTCINGQFDP